MATVPSIRDWVFGEFLTDTKMDEISSMLSFMSGSLGGFFIGYQTSAQSINNNTPTPINLEAEIVDVDGGHSTSVNTSRYTFQTNGYALVLARYVSAANVTGERRAEIYKNGSALSYGGRDNINAITQSGEPSSVSTWGIVSATSGDYVQLYGTQQSGGPLNTEVTSAKSGMVVVYFKTS